MPTKKLIVKSELVPYLNLFDLNKAWLDLKQERLEIIEQIREIRAKGYRLTMKINSVEEDISHAIQMLEKKNV